MVIIFVNQTRNSRTKCTTLNVLYSWACIHMSLKTNVIKISRIHKMQINWNKIFVKQTENIVYECVAHSPPYFTHAHLLCVMVPNECPLSVASWYAIHNGNTFTHFTIFLLIVPSELNNKFTKSYNYSK